MLTKQQQALSAKYLKIAQQVASVEQTQQLKAIVKAYYNFDDGFLNRNGDSIRETFEAKLHVGNLDDIIERSCETCGDVFATTDEECEFHCESCTSEGGAHVHSEHEFGFMEPESFDADYDYE